MELSTSKQVQAHSVFSLFLTVDETGYFYFLPQLPHNDGL